MTNQAAFAYRKYYYNDVLFNHVNTAKHLNDVISYELLYAKIFHNSNASSSNK